MNRIYESVRIEPMLGNSNTAAATSLRKIKWNDDQRMLFYFRMGGVAETGTALTATLAQICEFSLTEATASTHAGSVITGATMTLGNATAYKPRHAESLIITLTSVIGTSASFIVNGQGFHCGTVDLTTTATGCAAALAVAINGGATQEKLKHYSAIGNFTDTGVVLIYPDDGMGTGLTCTVANATDFKTRVPAYTGLIELKAESLSTHWPKWIGVSLSTESTSSAIRTVDCIRLPNNRPAFGGEATYV